MISLIYFIFSLNGEADGNMLTGEVPAELGNFKNLEKCHLDGNLLTGAIPESLCTLVKAGNLESLSADCLDPAEITCSCCSDCYLPEVSPDKKSNLDNNLTPIPVPSPTLGEPQPGQLDYMSQSEAPASVAQTDSVFSVPTFGQHSTSRAVDSTLIALLSSASPDGGAFLSDPSSSQYQTASWLSSDPDFSVFSDGRKTTRYALSMFMGQGNPDSWASQSGWVEYGVSECDWYGVDCDTQGNVVSLNLTSNGVGGTLVSELSMLQGSLRKLILNENNISSYLPSELGLLAFLTHLQLSNNEFDGEIPMELESLSNLEILLLNGNRLEGEIPTELGNLVRLIDLRLDVNELFTSMPTEFGNLAALQYLDVWNAPLDDQNWITVSVLKIALVKSKATILL